MAIQLRQLKAEIVPDLSKLSAGLAQADARFAQFAKTPRPAPQIEPPDQRISTALDAIAASAAKAQGEVTQTGQALGATGTQASKSEKELLSYASAVARLQQASGDAAGAQRTLQQALDAVEGQTRQSIQVATQLERVQGNVSGLTGSFDKLTSSLGSLGIAFGAQQILQFGADSLKSANTLEKTEATTRALAGTQERYNEVLALATDGQNKYGGSLNDNIKGLGALVNLSNRSGVELTQLDNISRRLATVDPVQGISGASFALKEFLAGSDSTAARSLIERFELSPKLKEIAASGATATEKIKALDAELNNLGITNTVLTNATNTTAATYDKLGSAFDNAKTKLGSFLADALQPAAVGLTRLINGDYSSLAASLRQVGEANPFLKLLPGFAQSQAQLDIIAARQKTTTADAIAPAKDYEDAVGRITRAEEQHAAATRLTADETTKLQTAMQTTAASGQEAAERLRDAQTANAQQSAERRQQLEDAVAEQQRQTQTRLADLDSSYLTQRTERAQQNAEQRAEVEDQARDKIAQIYAKLADNQIQETERATQKRADLEASFADAYQTLADRALDLNQSFIAKRTDIETQGAQKRLELEQQSAQQIASIQQRLADSQDTFNQQIADKQQAVQDRIADIRQNAADRSADAEQDYQDKVAELQAKQGQAKTPEEAARLDAQRAQLDREFQQKQERAQRDDQQAIEKLQRDQARDEARAQAQLAKQQQQLQAQIAAEQAALTEKEARQAAADQREAAIAYAKYAKDRETTQQAYDGKIADLQAAFDREEATRQQAYAKQIAGLQAQIQAEIVTTSERLQKQDLQDAAELAKIDAKFVKERASILTANDTKLADLQASFDKEETSRAAAFAKQEAQLKESLGKQLNDYTEQQLKLSLITAEEAARRQKIISSQYGLPTDGQAAQEFGAIAGNLGRTAVGPTAGSPGAAYAAYRNSQDTYVFNIAAGDPQQTALAIRDELARIQRQNGSTGI